MTLDMPGMSWIELAWPMISAASLTLAAIHVVIWLKDKGERANFMFALTALSVAVIAMIELRMMAARTPQEYGYLLRWAHVPVATLVLGMVGFVRMHFHAGSIVLALGTCVTRVACLLPNFLSGANLEFAEVTTLQELTIWGSDPIAAPLQVIDNPWVWLAHLNVILLLLFLASALADVWRRGPSPERRSAALVCGSLVFFALFAKVWPMLVAGRHVEGAVIISPAYLCVLLIMGYQLGGDMLRARQLARSLFAAELNLRVTQRKMDQAVNAAGIGLWNWDIAAGRSWFSEDVARMLELDPDDGLEVGQIMERMHPDDRHCFAEILQHPEEGSADFNLEFRVVMANGSTRWMVMRGQVDFDVSRAPLRMDGIVADITSRKDAEESFRLVIDNAPTAMIMFDSDGAIVIANQEAEVLFGFAPSEMIGMALDQLFPARFHCGHKDAQWKFLDSRRNVGMGGDLFGLRKDGREVPIDVALNTLHVEGDTCTLISVMDLSERNRMEQESSIQRDELAHLSRVALLSELSSSLAHELNQPLTAILANAQAAVRFLDHVPPNLGEVRDGLVNIIDSDKRAGEVIRRLRALLRKDRAEHRAVDVSEVVVDVLRIIRSDLLNRKVEVVLDLASSVPMVLGDKVQLQQVLLNLMMNASDAMADVERGREMLVRTRAAPDGGVVVSVTDVGSGIPRDDIQHVFTPFVTTKREGLGLGLAVCTSIIDAHAGSLWAANNDGPGATVGFRLPVNGSQRPEHLPPSS